MIRILSKYRNLVLRTIDILIIIFIYFFVEVYRIESFKVLEDSNFWNVVHTIIIAELVYQLFFTLFGCYNNIVRYESVKEYLVYGFISMISTVVTCMIGIILSIGIMDTKSNLLAGMVIAVMFITYRAVIRLILNDSIVRRSDVASSDNQKNLLIIGGGAATRDIIKIVKTRMQKSYKPVGIIDDDPNKLNYTIAGVKIVGDRYKIQEVCKRYDVGAIFFAISNISNKDKKEILDMCQLTGAKLRILPSTADIITNKTMVQNLRDVEIDDLLGRDEITLDNKNISGFIKEKVVLVTGGGGSIGSELCRQVMKYSPKKLVILDIYENNLYDIELELKALYPDGKISALVGSVRDTKRLDEIFNDFKPEVVFHAAAHKHVPLMEENPLEAIKNNVFGTYNVANCADKYGVKRFVLISTDKAVNPTNIMGASKRLCEMIIQAKDKISKTEYIAVRFGNVLGSNGSVIPLFKKQIANGGPVTVTHKDITRFFMTIPEAVQLILQAATYAEGGEIFVLDMGEPVRIFDLAVSLIKLSGLEPEVDIPINITGLRPGEKLYEELLMEEEGLTATKHNKIFVSKPIDETWEMLESKIETVGNLEYDSNYSKEHIKEVMKSVVPTYRESKK